MTDDDKIHRGIELATLASVAAIAKNQASVNNPPGTRRKKRESKQRRKQAKKSRRRNR